MRDVNRTMTNNEFFSSKESQMKLLSILRAYANFDPEVGYTQGMNYIVGALLLLMNPENDKATSKEYFLLDQEYEANVFWIFVFIMQNKGWRDVLKDETPKLISMIEYFSSRLEKDLFHIWNHLIMLDV